MKICHNTGKMKEGGGHLVVCYYYTCTCQADKYNASKHTRISPPTHSLIHILYGWMTVNISVITT